MNTPRLSAFAFASLVLASCGDDAPSNFPTNSCDDFASAHCVEIRGGDVASLLDATNALEADTTIVLGKGTFVMTSQILVQNTTGITIVGQGIDTTTLSYTTATTQFNGVEVTNVDDFVIQDLTVLDSPKDGIRIEASDGVVYRRIRATWTNPGLATNGAYGIYPVHSQNVLVEDSFAENASDAGLYVGQCENVIVRNNTVRGNVAGLEIENTQYADVYANTAENNTAGIVVFDLPGNPIVGRDVRVRDNTIRQNNGINFGKAGTTVAAIPVGTGTFAMASRRVEITGNTYIGNDTVDIAIVSGLIVEQDPSKWAHLPSTLVGTYLDLDLDVDPNDAAKLTNFRSEEIVISGNTHMDSGFAPDPSDPMMLGFLLSLIYPSSAIDSVLYDTIGEGAFDSTDPLLNSNDNHICVGGNTGGTFGSMNLEAQNEAFTMGQPLIPFFRPVAPFTPFGCTALTAGPVAAVVLP